jgi:hypothetical protein
MAKCIILEQFCDGFSSKKMKMWSSLFLLDSNAVCCSGVSVPTLPNTPPRASFRRTKNNVLGNVTFLAQNGSQHTTHQYILLILSHIITPSTN